MGRWRCRSWISSAAALPDGVTATAKEGSVWVGTEPPPTDVRGHDPAHHHLAYVYENALMNGPSETTFSPYISTTRGMIVTILARMEGVDTTKGAAWYAAGREWAMKNGISDGTNPNGTINRAQMVTMLWRAMGQPAAGGSASFADVPADNYYAQAVAWAVENGITAGVGNGRFDPNSTCTRAQIAAFLARSMK